MSISLFGVGAQSTWEKSSPGVEFDSGAGQMDQAEALNSAGFKGNHRLSFQFNKELKRNVVCIIDNYSGEVVKKIPSDDEVAHLVRLKRLLGLFFDVRA